MTHYSLANIGVKCCDQCVLLRLQYFFPPLMRVGLITLSHQFQPSIYFEGNAGYARTNWTDNYGGHTGVTMNNPTGGFIWGMDAGGCWFLLTQHIPLLAVQVRKPQLFNLQSI